MSLCLGKAPAKHDTRTLKFSTILNKANLPPLPAEYDIDAALGVSDKRMFLNDTYGDCVEAGSAHMINRFEMFECKAMPDIPDADVKTQYFKETCGGDNGLVLLDHLNLWRKEGLSFGGKIYTIDAFASIHWKDHTEVAYAIYLLNGIYLGMQVPAFFMSGFENGKRYFDTQCTNRRIEGGHCIYGHAYKKLPKKIKVVGFNDVGPIIETWAEDVQLTWKFWDLYLDEAYAIVDSIDKWMNPATDPIKTDILTGYLNALCSN